MIFWRLTGLGISSRMADSCLYSLESLHMLSAREAVVPSNQELDSAHGLIHERIATTLNSPSKNERVPSGITRRDVYLYQSGMADIYRLHQVLLH